MAADDAAPSSKETPTDAEKMDAGSTDSDAPSPGRTADKQEKGVLLGMGQPSSFEPEEDPDHARPSEQS